MSRPNGPIGQRGPQWRHPADDPYAQPQTGQPGPAWPNQPHQGGYADPNAGQAQPQQGYYFPQGAEQDPGYGYPPQAPPGQPSPFERFQPPPAFPQTPQPQWTAQQQDPRGYDLGSYMPSGGQPGYAPAGGPPFQAQPDQLHAQYGPAQGYGDNDHEYDDMLAEGEEDTGRSRRGLMIAAALVGAIGIGGGLAYGYKTFIASGSSGRAPFVRATDFGANKVRPVNPGGKEFAHTDKKLLNRLGEDGGQQRPGEAADDRAADDPSAPRRVRVIPITPSGNQAQAPGAAPARPAGPPMVAVPGIALDNFGAQQARPAPPPVQAAPAQPAPPVVAVPAPAAPPAPEPQVQKKVAAAAPAVAAPVKASPPKARDSVPAPASSGFVAVLSSQKSRMDAVKAYASIDQKYRDMLASNTFDVQEADLGEKGVWYRAVVGPPRSFEGAKKICEELKAAGYSGCWPARY